jgi:hypothetical protein
MNKTLIVLVCALAVLGVAGAAEAHVTYQNPVTGDCGELPLPIHADLSNGACDDHGRAADGP